MATFHVIYDPSDRIFLPPRDSMSPPFRDAATVSLKVPGRTLDKDEIHKVTLDLLKLLGDQIDD